MRTKRQDQHSVVIYLRIKVRDVIPVLLHRSKVKGSERLWTNHSHLTYLDLLNDPPLPVLTFTLVQYLTLSISSDHTHHVVFLSVHFV